MLLSGPKHLRVAQVSGIVAGVYSGHHMTEHADVNALSHLPPRVAHQVAIGIRVEELAMQPTEIFEVLADQCPGEDDLSQATVTEPRH